MENSLPDITQFDKVIELLETIRRNKLALKSLRAKAANHLRSLTIDDLTHVRESVSEIGYDDELDEVYDTLFNRVYLDE